MKIKLKVRKMGEERKVFEVPLPVRDNFKIGEFYNFEQLEDIEKITRLEVIEVGEKTKRKYVARDIKIEKSVQDGGRTLKLFVEKEETK